MAARPVGILAHACRLLCRPLVTTTAYASSLSRCNTNLEMNVMEYRSTCLRQFHSSLVMHDLIEFFDAKETWTESSVVCGRPWKKDELRLKSNQDLHKLWYVLLKERNALMTMEEEYNRAVELFPSPERMEKVEESMENLLRIVGERDVALHLLETGKTGQPEQNYKRNFLGLVYFRQFQQHAVPWYMNRNFKLLHKHYLPLHRHYIRLYHEKLLNRARSKRRRERRVKKKLSELFVHAEL